jgi:hypothetical protein
MHKNRLRQAVLKRLIELAHLGLWTPLQHLEVLGFCATDAAVDDLGAHPQFRSEQHGGRCVRRRV